MAANDRALIFVSSSMSELPEERAIVKKVVKKLGDGTFETYLFEEDAVPGADSPQDEWQRQLEETQVTLALLYQKFGKYTEEEIRLSRKQKIPVLLFRKKDKEQSLETAAPEFVGWLQDAESGVITKWFDTPKQLKKAVKEALQKEIKVALVSLQGVRRSATPMSVDGMTLKESKAPDVGPRSEPPRQLPTQKFFVGRDDEKRQLLDAIEVARESEDDRYIVLVGPPGIGKEALLRHLTHAGDLPDFPDGAAVAPNWKDREDLEDLLQALWEQFYDPDNVVDPRKRDSQLKDVEALVFLVGLDDAADIREVVEATMPKSVFCGTVVEFDTLAEPLPVDALTDDEEICAIFEKSYGSGFPDSATRTTFAELSRRQGGNPGKIEFLGKQAKLKARPSSNAEGPHPLIAWVAEMAREEGLTPCAPRLTAVASEVGDGVHTPTRVLELVVPDESIEQADAAGCLEAASPRYRLNPVLEPQRDPEVLSDLFAGTLEWVRTAPRAEIFANRAFVLQMMSRGLTEQRWADVIALGRSAESSLALGARHGAWKELLEGVGRAAQANGDDATLSWALHQLGSRALLRDELRQGRGYLHQSFQHREDDEDARELTRRNLMLLPAAVIPFAALVLVPLFSILVVVAISRHEERDPNLDVEFATVVLPTDEVLLQTNPLEVWNGADDAREATVVIDDASIDRSPVEANESGICVVVDGRCVDGQRSGRASELSGQLLCPRVAVEEQTLTVLAAEPCVLNIGFLPDVPGTHRATLRVVTPDGVTYEGTISGTATAGIVEISPDSKVFEDTGAQTFTVTNVGTTSIDVGDPSPRSIPGAAEGVEADFTVGDLDCAGDSRTLEPEQSCQVTVTYSGGQGGAFLEFEISVTEDGSQPIIGDERVLLIALDQPPDT